jgi:hypothetical protein
LLNFPFFTFAHETENEEIEEIYDVIKEFEEKLNIGIDLSGYVDVEYNGSDKEGSNDGFRMHHLSLFFAKEFNHNLQFFSEIEFEDTPKFVATNDGSGDIKEAEGKIFVEAVNFDYRYKQWLNMRIGRFFTPAGIWSEDHYPPFVTTQSRPLHIRNIFPQLVDGLSLYGTKQLSEKSFLQYVTYFGNGESKTAGKKDNNNDKAIGLRLNLIYPLADEFSIGMSTYKDSEDTANGDSSKTAWGVHAKLRIAKFIFQSEWAKANYDFNKAPYIDDKRDGLYFQTSYVLDKWTLGHRYDIYNASENNSEEVERNSAFINYHYSPNIVFKAEYHVDDFDLSGEKNVNSFTFSIAAYLGN